MQKLASDDRVPLVYSFAELFTYSPAAPFALRRHRMEPRQLSRLPFSGPSRALSGNTITVKNDAGATMQVTVEENARLLRIEPGQKTLAGASPFSLSRSATGRSGDGPRFCQRRRQLWLPLCWLPLRAPTSPRSRSRSGKTGKRRGTGGLVKSVDPAAGTVTISSGSRWHPDGGDPRFTHDHHSPLCPWFSEVRPGCQEHP